MRINIKNPWLINYILNTSSVTNYTAFNSNQNNSSSYGNPTAALYVGAQHRAGAGSYNRIEKFNNKNKK